MKSRDEVLEKLREAKPELVRKFGVQRLAIFGSYARGDQREDSDVDILVEIEPSIRLGFVDLALRIEEILGLPVQIVSRRAIKPRSWEVIEKELIDVP